MLYFAYGSNLNIEQMTRRCPDAKPLGSARLRGWQLVFRGVADIQRARGKVVHGGLWSITPSDLRNLDRYEGFPYLYLRHIVEVETSGRPIQAIVYRMTRSDELGLPSPGYLRTCLDGFAAWGLPSWHLRRALREAGRWLLEAGVTELVPKGKRMVPAPRNLTPGMTRATRLELGLEDPDGPTILGWSHRSGRPEPVWGQRRT